ncbi:MAG TPA: hypothetical protein DF698_05785 [Candidatus Atribacteria bacterium]|nr:hypothetical protein [Candidatus Atribacteria bacterium]
MDLVILSTTAVTLISAFFSQAGKGFAKKAGEAAWKKTEKLFNYVTLKIKGNMSAEEALSDLKKTPDDLDARAALRVQLRKILSEDNEFAKELEKIVNTIKVAGGDIIIQQFTMSGGRADSVIQLGKGNVEK